MAIYLVNSAGDGTDNGAANTLNPTATDWGKAEPTMAGALALATTNGDYILIDSSHQEAGASFTLTSTTRLRIFVVDKDNSNALDTMENGGGYFATNTGSNMALSWGDGTYIDGINIVHSATGSRTISIGGAANVAINYRNSRFAIENTGHTGFWQAQNGLDSPCAINFDNCKFVVANAANHMSSTARLRFSGCSWSLFTAGTAPTVFFRFGRTDPGGADVECFGCDLSILGSNALVGGANTASGRVSFAQCKLGTGYVMLDASSTPNTAANAQVHVFDCASDDTHTAFAYEDKLGKLVCDTTIKFTGGAAGLSWYITTTSICNESNPFVTPWVNLYNTGTSAITPRLEIHRDNNATAWQNDEVWGEFSAKVTSGSTQATIYSDRMPILGSPADQTAGTDTWDADNATHWSGKVNTTSNITPAENGHLRARVCVGIQLDGTSGNVLRVDPQIRT
jgi:hypothetical protein